MTSISKTPESNWFYSLWKFSRPHTIIGTTLSVLGIYFITRGIHNQTISPISLIGAWVACILGNIYIVGLNQLEDIEIDKINKPHLPLAAGEYSIPTGKSIVATCGILALLIAFFQSPYLLGMVGISLLIGTAYSLPPIRFKRFPLLAAICIFSVRGAIVNLGLYLHYNWTIQQPPTIPATIWIITLFVLIFTIAIAIFKDIPDMEGDAQYNIATLSLKLGKETVFKLSLWIITTCYLGIIITGNLQPNLNHIFLTVTHLIPLIWMWQKSRKIDLESKAEITNFYQFIWKLFFLEYLVFPIATLT
ncbi:homogentisate phytyltransferase [Calothrix sp. PCC 6303]|uniref:homogentisate phytyltransferase n=1 Tax=Calothrix sp. PCC 6303 TaxID=1170562 RepID=UPI0002A00EE6|nr:homogentisate phytyltransferase [Calothrix sp. PCC 6303]AFZ01104.1 homogentisate phytyltransferase [Calothrix sp. PCC 6303]